MNAVGDLFLLPRDFVEAYAELFHESFQDGQAGEKESGKTGGGGYRGGWLVRSEKALERKRYVDRELRALARRIKKGSWKDVDKMSRCRCGSWLGADQKFCSKCGALTGVGAAGGVTPSGGQEGGG